MDQINPQPNRRAVLTAGAMAFMVAAIAPHLAVAKASDVEAEIKKLFGSTAIAEGRIKLDLPAIAENGLVVPLGIDVESAMTATDYVKSVHVFADGNPLPGLVSFFFTPAAGKASASTRIRLAQTQNIIAIAEMADGRLFAARQEVKVTIGGCGG
jgi:sulfur-oxidizing protein SoxY